MKEEVSEMETLSLRRPYKVSNIPHTDNGVPLLSPTNHSKIRQKKKKSIHLGKTPDRKGERLSWSWTTRPKLILFFCTWVPQELDSVGEWVSFSETVLPEGSTEDLDIKYKLFPL